MRAAALVLIGLTTVTCAPKTSPGEVLDGVYTLNIQSTCTALPAAVRNRDYIASVQGSTVTLSGGTFWMHPSRGLMNQFSMGGTDDRVGLRFDPLSVASLPGLVEETAPGEYLNIIGTGSGELSGHGSETIITGTLAVGIGWGQDLLDDARHTGCAVGTHTATFQFRRRPTTSVPPPGVARTIVRLQVSGPASVAPQEAAQFVATGHYPDGTTRDVSLEAGWHRGVSLAIDVGPSGLVTGRSIGESVVTAAMRVPNTIGEVRDSREVIVVPSGTVRISGIVTTGVPGQPVVNAVVAVVSGSSAGLSTSTDWDGRYALYGVAGASQIRASKDGFQSNVVNVDGASHQTLNLPLQQVSGFPNVAGTYTLTIAADGACPTPLPPPLNIRTYSATITQAGRVLTVVLGGASFLVVNGRGNSFPGLADPFQLSFQLDDNDHFDIGNNLDVVEELGGASVLFLLGTITTDVSPTRLSGKFGGVFQRAERALPSLGFFWGQACQSDNHQVVFAR